MHLHILFDNIIILNFIKAEKKIKQIRSLTQLKCYPYLCKTNIIYYKLPTRFRLILQVYFNSYHLSTFFTSCCIWWNKCNLKPLIDLFYTSRKEVENAIHLVRRVL